MDKTYVFSLQEQRMTVVVHFSTQQVYNRKVVTCTIEGREATCTGIATCNPHDTFSLETGMRLALRRSFDRLMAAHSDYSAQARRGMYHALRTKLLNADAFVSDEEKKRQLDELPIPF
jgi:hypothetical protein